MCAPNLRELLVQHVFYGGNITVLFPPSAPRRRIPGARRKLSCDCCVGVVSYGEHQL
jgi:hypothetical protein